MKRVFKTFAIFVVVALLLMIGFNGAFASQEKAPTSVTLLCGVSGGTWFSIGSVVSQIFRNAGINSSVEIGGGVSNVIMIDRKDAELGMTMTITPPIARKAEPPFEEKHTDVMGVCTLFTNFAHIMVTESSGITSIDQLKGKEFASQPVGTSTQQAFNDILSVYGLSEDDLKITRGGQSEGAALVKDRHVVGLTATTAAPSATLSEMALFTPIRVLSISDEKFKELSAINNGYVRTMLPAGTYPGQDEPVPGVRADTILIVNRNMPEDEVYWITKVLVENLEGLQSAHASMKDLTVDEMAKVGGVELHPGARKYYEENFGEICD